MARRKEGPRAPLFYSGLAIMLMSAAGAQTVDLSRLEECAGLANEESRLACFEAIINESENADRSVPEAAEAVVTDPPVAEVDALAETPAEVANQEVPVVDAAPEPSAEMSTPAASAAAPAVTATAATTSAAKVAAPAAATNAQNPVAPQASATPVDTPPAAADASSLGEKYLDRPPEEADVYYATVTDVTKGRNKVLYFHFENGQVWRQIEGRNFQYPKDRSFDVTINRGMMGEYRMRIGDNSRMVRIRRVQ